MKKIIATIILFIFGGGIIWIIYSKGTDKNYNKSQQTSQAVVSGQPSEKEPDATPQPEETKNTQAYSQPSPDVSSNDSSQATSPFPPPTVEKIGNVMQRTIHMGVRQWEWVPVKITANYGESVILIMHNADVTHSISIPDLNVKQDIPEDGAIVKFTATKRGTFTFFCDTPCGKGHNLMKGEITIL